MSKYCCATVLLIGILPILGCADSPDALIEQQIVQIKEMTKAIDEGADEATIKTLEDSMTATSEALDKLTLSKEEQTRIDEKYAVELTNAVLKLTEAKAKKMGGQFQGMMKDMQGQMGGSMPNITPGDIPMPKFPK